MPNFIFDSSSVNFPKTDLNPLPGGADPTKYVAAVDWNSTNQAVVDIRSALTGLATGSINIQGAVTGGLDLTLTRNLNVGSLATIGGNAIVTGSQIILGTTPVTASALQLGFVAPNGIIASKNTQAAPASNLYLETTDGGGNTNRTLDLNFDKSALFYSNLNVYGTASVVGSFTGSGNATFNGTLNQFGAGGVGYAYFNNDELDFHYSDNSAQTGYINFHGYQAGATQARSLSVRDGQTNEIVLFSGLDKSVTMRGALSAAGSVTGTHWFSQFADNSVSFGANATQIGAIFLNTDGTDNNWATLQFGSSYSTPTAIMGVRNTNHASNLGQFSFGTRGTDGFNERFRIGNQGETTVIGGITGSGDGTFSRNLNVASQLTVGGSGIITGSLTLTGSTSANLSIIGPQHLVGGGASIFMQATSVPNSNRWSFRLRATDPLEGAFGIYDENAAAFRVKINPAGNVYMLGDAIVSGSITGSGGVILNSAGGTTTINGNTTIGTTNSNNNTINGQTLLSGSNFASIFNYNGDGVQSVYIRPGFAGGKVIVGDQHTGSILLGQSTNPTVTLGLLSASLSAQVTGTLGISGSLFHSPSSGKVGFYGTTPVLIPNVTGSRSGTGANSAQVGLLNALTALGLITNNTTG